MDAYKAYYHDDTGKPANGSVKVTFLGTSTLLIDDGETQLLTDGFLSRLSLIQTLTSKLLTDEKVVDDLLTRFQMNRVKGIFVTHSHYDHAFDVAYVTRWTNAKLYGSESTLNIGRGGGLKEEQLSLFEPGKEIQFGRFSVIVLNSKHSPMTSFNDDLGKVIDKPLNQPAKLKEYVEGGSFDFLIKHNGHIIFIKPNLNYIEGSLDSLRADVLFLGIGTLSKQSDDFKAKYYEETVRNLKPKLVLPLHWDNFLLPFSEELQMLPNFADDTSASFQSIIQKTKTDNMEFKILQGGKSIVLFADGDAGTK